VPGHSLASSLGGRAPLRALRVLQTGVMQSVCPGRRTPATKAGPLPRFLFVSGARRVVCVRCSLVRRFAHGFQSAGFARVLAVGPRPPRSSFASLTSPAPWPVRPPRGLPPGRGCPAGGGRRWSTAGPPRPSGAATRRTINSIAHRPNDPQIIRKTSARRPKTALGIQEKILLIF
jgi:hypothetical protein